MRPPASQPFNLPTNRPSARPTNRPSAYRPTTTRDTIASQPPTDQPIIPPRFLMPAAVPPSSPTASSTSATAATAEPEDNTNDYSLRTRKLGSSPVPSEIVRSESEPWQPTTSSAIGLPSPSPPLPPPFLTCATASHHTTPLSPNRAVRPSDSTESPPTPTTTISPSDRSVATAAGRAFGETVG